MDTMTAHTETLLGPVAVKYTFRFDESFAGALSLTFTGNTEAECEAEFKRLAPDAVDVVAEDGSDDLDNVLSAFAATDAA